MKNYKSTESLCFSFLFTQMIGLLFDMLLSFLLLFLFLLFYFFAGFVNMCKPRTVFYLLSRAGPPGLAYYGSGLVCFPSWLGMLNARWLGSMRSGKSSLKMKFTIFQGCPTKQAAFVPAQPSPYNELIIQPLLLVAECYFV